MMARLLILACSGTKNHNPGPMPAAWRYKGAYYQSLHKLPAAEWPDIIILSAKMGFIKGTDPIDDYDMRMDTARSWELIADEKQGEILRRLCQGEYAEIFVAAGELYRNVIHHHLDPEILPTVKYATGDIGYQRSQLKKWLLEKSIA